MDGFSVLKKLERLDNGTAISSQRIPIQTKVLVPERNNYDNKHENKNNLKKTRDKSTTVNIEKA